MFRTAVVRLTVLFSAVLLLVFAGFAVGVYAYVVASFDFDSVGASGSGAIDAAEQSFADLRSGLLVGCLVLAVVVPVLCWLMVKLVLRPVRHGYEDQQRFVDDASHEFRTPLAVVQTELELAVSRPRDGAAYRAAITRALEQVEHLTALTSDLLMLARGSSIDVESGFGPVDIVAVADRAASDPTGRIRLHAPRHAVLVRGSEDLLLRAVANVVDNARKFSADDTPVEVRVEEQGDRVRVEVTDRGVGFAPGERGRAFDRFWRAPAARSLPGNGLGLALVLQIVTAHRGTVRLTAGSAGGTTVTIELPALR
ncbi:sensor histidine kinase [Microbacterium sp. CJ88]|uniref:sensor histidine kinase n=1 Tax=Microbacterium sp. CJ88 TaxID=3445672 RepID=UPI003F65BC89